MQLCEKGTAKMSVSHLVCKKPACLSLSVMLLCSSWLSASQTVTLNSSVCKSHNQYLLASEDFITVVADPSKQNFTDNCTLQISAQQGTLKFRFDDGYDSFIKDNCTSLTLYPYRLLNHHPLVSII